MSHGRYHRNNSEEISSRILAVRDKGGFRCNGFGGECERAADFINRKVFDGRGKIVGAANTFWLARGRFLGHVAVLYKGRYWDLDGRPKDWEDIESWGMLAPDDPDHFAPGWNDEAAEGVSRLNEKQVRQAWTDES
jgi:hypothetical protein